MKRKKKKKKITHLVVCHHWTVDGPSVKMTPGSSTHPLADVVTWGGQVKKYVVASEAAVMTDAMICGSKIHGRTRLVVTWAAAQAGEARTHAVRRCI